MNLLTNRCGTYSTVWLNNQHPSSDQGIISCEVCANVFNITVECPWPWNIRVKNCGGFFVYELKATPYCPMRYCTSIWKKRLLIRPLPRLKTAEGNKNLLQGASNDSVMQVKKNSIYRETQGIYLKIFRKQSLASQILSRSYYWRRHHITSDVLFK